MNVDFLEKCLKILKTSKSDNELLAALLVVTKVTKAQECDDVLMKRIFDAIGFKFLSKLLRTGRKATPTEESTSQAFPSIAVNVISSFCGLPGVIKNPEFIVLLPHLAAITAQQTTDDIVCQLIRDCYECLTRIACQPGGSLVLVHSGCVLHLCQAVIHKGQYHEQGLQLLVHLCTVCGSQTWNGTSNYLALIILHLTQEMDLDETEKKFQLCSTIGTLLMHAPEGELDNPDYTAWLLVIEKLLFNILKNKLGAETRAPVLRLCSVMIELCGVKWALQPDTKFLLLLVHLACIELRMALDTEDLEKIKNASSLLATCYNLLEHVIEYMTAGPSLQLDSTQITQLHAAMVGAFNAVIHFLSRMTDHPSCETVRPVVIASVRVLGAWIAEETSALREEVIALLVFLIRTGRETFHQCQKIPQSTGKTPQDVPTVDPEPAEASASVKKLENFPDPMSVSQEDLSGPNLQYKTSTILPTSQNMDLQSLSSIEVLQFLMPGFCHLSAEDAPRKIMLTCDLPQLLYEYMTYQFWRLHESDKSGINKEPEVALLTMCGVLLNLAVLEGDLVTNNPVFGDIAEMVMKKYQELQANGPSNLALPYNLMVLGLMIIRHRPETAESSRAMAEGFFRSSVQLLKNTHSFGKPDGRKGTMLCYHDQWENISEYWLLAVQVLSVCIGELSWLPKLILTSKWLPSICNLLLNVKGDSVPVEVQKAYGDLLEALVNASPMAHKVVKESGGNQLARKYKFEGLQLLFH